MRFVVLTAESLKTQAFWYMTLLCFITLRADGFILVFFNLGGGRRATFLSFFFWIIWLHIYSQFTSYLFTVPLLLLNVAFLVLTTVVSDTCLKSCTYHPVSLHARHMQLPVTFTLAEHTNNRNVMPTTYTAVGNIYTWYTAISNYGTAYGYSWEWHTD